MAAHIALSIAGRFVKNTYCTKLLNPLLRYNSKRNYTKERGLKSVFLNKTLLKLSILGVGSIGVVYLYKSKSTISAANPQSLILSELPLIKPSKSIVYENDKSGLNLTLYQYQTCPFCCKVRTFLEYHQISHDIVEVNPVTRKQIKFSEYRKVPILISKGKVNQQLNDSSLIISALQSLVLDENKQLDQIVSYYPVITYQDEKGKNQADITNKYFLMLDNVKIDRSTEDQLEERKWRLWADNTLVHVLSPNVYRSPSEALQTFNYFSEVGEWEKHFATLERLMVIYVGACAMYLISKRLKRRHNLKNDVRQSFYEVCNEWMRAIGKHRKFMGGDKPNLADLAVYGVLTSVEGCEAFKDVLNHTRIGSWYFEVKNTIAIAS